MKKTRIHTGINFTDIKPDHVQRMVKDLYSTGEDEKRDLVFGQAEDRRQGDRRQKNQQVILDTRSSQSRRQASGRRQRDDNEGNKNKLGIDDYA